MEEGNTTPATQAQAASVASTPAQAATNPPEPQAGEGNDAISLDEAKKLRREAQALRQRLKGYEDAEAAAAAAKLSETEKLQKQFADLQSQHDAYKQQTQERIVRYEVERQASKLGIIDPDAAARLLDQAKLEFDDDGLPTNAEPLLKELLKNKPYLAAQAQQTTPASPAQTAATPGAPALPAMNPGRSQINRPGAAQPGKIPRLHDVYGKRH